MKTLPAILLTALVFVAIAASYQVPYIPTAPGDAAKFLDGTYNWTTPAGTGGSGGDTNAIISYATNSAKSYADVTFAPLAGATFAGPITAPTVEVTERVIGEPVQFTWILGDAINTIAVGGKAMVRVPKDCVLTGWDVVCSALGSGTTASIQNDVWVDAYADFPPTVSDSITGGNYAAISADVKATGNPVSNWATTNLTAGEYIALNVVTVSGDPTQVTVTLYGQTR